MSSPGEVTRLLAEIKSGNRQAEADLIPLVYDELRRLAHHYMQSERPDHTLQATAVVHEAYLRLVKQRNVTWESKAHFFAVAASLMRRILCDYARRHSRRKRGGDQEAVPLDEAPVFSQEKSEEMIDVDRALTRLAEVDPRQGQIVELLFFAGFTVEETAEVLDISPRTVKRDWSVARVWLHREIAKGKSS